MDGLEETRPSYEPPSRGGIVIKRVREDKSSDEESSNDSGKLMRRKRKKIMRVEPAPKIQVRPLRGV